MPQSRKVIRKRPFSALLFLLLHLVVMLVLYYLLDIPSPYATNASLIISGGLLLGVYRGLIIPSLITGVLMAVGTLPFYYLVMFMNKDFLTSYFQTYTLSGSYVTGIPVEDLLFYFLTGVFFGPLFRLGRDERLKKRSKS